MLAQTVADQGFGKFRSFPRPPAHPPEVSDHPTPRLEIVAGIARNWLGQRGERLFPCGL